jgi:hypothetical protein
MDAGMPLQMLTVDKSFATLITVKRLFPCVGHHMLPQFASGGKLLPAHTADCVSNQR